MQVADAFRNLFDPVKRVVSSIDIVLLDFDDRYVMQTFNGSSFTIVYLDRLLVGHDCLRVLFPVEENQSLEVNSLAVARIDLEYLVDVTLGKVVLLQFDVANRALEPNYFKDARVLL